MASDGQFVEIAKLLLIPAMYALGWAHAWLRWGRKRGD